MSQRSNVPLYPGFSPEVNISIEEDLPPAPYPQPLRSRYPQQQGPFIPQQQGPFIPQQQGPFAPQPPYQGQPAPSRYPPQPAPSRYPVQQPRSGITLLNQPKPPVVTPPQYAPTLASPTLVGLQPSSVVPVNVVYSPAGTIPLPMVAPAHEQSFWRTPMGIIAIIALVAVIGLIVFFLIKFFIDERNRAQQQQQNSQQRLTACTERATRLASELHTNQGQQFVGSEGPYEHRTQPVNIASRDRCAVELPEVVVI